jgi:hypothetical protein
MSGKPTVLITIRVLTVVFVRILVFREAVWADTNVLHKHVASLYTFTSVFNATLFTILLNLK